LRTQARVAQEQGIYVVVMISQGWSVFDSAQKNRGLRGNAWPGHPYKFSNNINGVDGDPAPTTGAGDRTQTLLPESGAFRGFRGLPEGLFITILLRFCYSEPYLTFG